MTDRPTPWWQRMVAALVIALLVFSVTVWRGRLGADFVPLDASRVGPNLIASVIQWAVIFVVGVLVWPPTRRRLHRFIDRKVAPIHAKLARVEEHHAWEHAAHLALLHDEPLPPHPHYDRSAP